LSSFDIIVLVVIGLSGMYGYKKGIISVISYWVALILGYIIATKYSALTEDQLNDYLGDNIWNPISYLFTFLLTFIIIRLIGKLIVKFLKITQLNIFNRLAGAFFFIVLGIILLGLFTHFWLRISKKPVSTNGTSNFHKPIEEIGKKSVVGFYRYLSPIDTLAK